ncbi:MAG TPA: NADH-quinone oxidoreductase subunit L [Candidatus Dormibacteraeota bacterium]
MSHALLAATAIPQNGMSTDKAKTLVILVLVLPLAGALLNAALGPRLGRRFVNYAGTLSILASLIVTLVVFFTILGADQSLRSTTVTLWTYIDLGPGNLNVDVSFTLDQLSAVMMLVITGVGFLIHVYSVGYMEHDATPHRFFSYMNLFIFSMLLLVLAANLLILIVGWAMVGLASYLLIGYYYERRSAVLAARKAFITQVIGDIAMVVAAFMLVLGLGAHSLSLPVIFATAHDGFAVNGAYVTAICMLLALGAFAKSAQFPLHTWLPDAMEGPTPVSALIHAATMVTAGVYLIARFHTLFDMSVLAQGMVACVGMGTALMAGVIALSQIDIKRVIAFSTMSQIGLMIFAVGIGAYSAGMFHFITHAFFKALLFLAAGNVIHALHDEQDVRLMGGVERFMTNTGRYFLVGSVALAGIIPFAGYYSKEDLLGFGAVYGPGAPALYIAGLVVNVLTGIYAFRLYFLVFHGEPQTARISDAKEARRVMLVPVALLALGSVVSGFLLQFPLPGIGKNVIGDWLNPVFAQYGGTVLAEPSTATVLLTQLIGLAASLLGVGLARQWFFFHSPDAEVVASRVPRFLTLLSLHRFYFDDIYDAVLVRPSLAAARGVRRVIEPRYIDGAVRGVGSALSELSVDFRTYQTGFIRDYAAIMTIGAVGFVAIMVLLVAR